MGGCFFAQGFRNWLDRAAREDFGLLALRFDPRNSRIPVWDWLLRSLLDQEIDQ